MVCRNSNYQALMVPSTLHPHNRFSARQMSTKVPVAYDINSVLSRVQICLLHLLDKPMNLSVHF